MRKITVSYNLSILSDPYETLGHLYRGKFSDFSTVMNDSALPFDNIYTSAEGFIARQVGSNNPYYRLLTWEFSINCHSFVTIPLSTLPLDELGPFLASREMQDAWKQYSIGPKFSEALIAKGLHYSRVLNLNLLLHLIIVIVARHLQLVGHANVKGPFYIKANLENVWRAVPFVDAKSYMKHLEQFDIPVVQVSELLAPAGTGLDSFVVTPELERLPSEDEGVVPKGVANIWLAIMEALGIPRELLSATLSEFWGCFSEGNRNTQIKNPHVNENPSS